MSITRKSIRRVPPPNRDHHLRKHVKTRPTRRDIGLTWIEGPAFYIELIAKY